MLDTLRCCYYRYTFDLRWFTFGWLRLHFGRSAHVTLYPTVTTVVTFTILFGCVCTRRVLLVVRSGSCVAGCSPTLYLRLIWLRFPHALLLRSGCYATRFVTHALLVWLVTDFYRVPVVTFVLTFTLAVLVFRLFFTFPGSVAAARYTLPHRTHAAFAGSHRVCARGCTRLVCCVALRLPHVHCALVWLVTPLVTRFTPHVPDSPPHRCLTLHYTTGW